MLILWFKGLKKRGEPCKCEKKVGLARRVTRLAAGSLFCGGRFTILADPTFLHTNTSARPAGHLVKTRQSKYVRALLTRQKGQLFFPLTQLEGDPLFRDNFSSYERGVKG